MLTCADVKARYTAPEEEGLNCLVPTPAPEARNVLEAHAPMNDFYARSLDIVAAFGSGRNEEQLEGSVFTCLRLLSGTRLSQLA